MVKASAFEKQAVGGSNAGFRNLVYELMAGQVGTGSAWKLYTCCAAAILVSGTRVAPSLHPGTLTGVKVFSVYYLWLYLMLA